MTLFEKYLDGECARSTEEIMANFRQEERTPCPFTHIAGWSKGWPNRKCRTYKRDNSNQVGNTHAKGMKWYNNGIKNKRSRTDPGGMWKPGRLIPQHHKDKMNAHLSDLIRDEKGRYVGRK